MGLMPRLQSRDVIIHIHTSSFTFTPPLAELQSDHSVVRRSRGIDAEIAISWGDHSHSHLIIHIHTSSAERQSDHSAFRRSRENVNGVNVNGDV